MNEAMKRLLKYSFEPINWNYEQLTSEEKKLCTLEEFEEIEEFVNLPEIS